MTVEGNEGGSAETGRTGPNTNKTKKTIKTTIDRRQSLTISLQHCEHIGGTDWGGC